ncbi:MAG: beta-lactamase family protein [Roseivirga sp.]|nr:beta-lactamase family protein [Roseivirga sp.]
MKLRLKISLFVLLILPFSLQCQSKKSLLSPTFSEIDAIFSNYDNSETPGAAIAVVHKGQIIYKKGYGSANLEYDISITPTTVFHVASVSKQFTAFAIMLLVEDGKLSLDDDIRKHIPEVPDFGKKITLRHLASHTSGLRDQWELLILGGWRLDDVITMDHILDMVSRQNELNFTPGEKYMYSNTGFTLLAEVVARVSGQSFSRFTQMNIFEPLGMKNTQFYDDHERIVKNRAYSYRPQRNGGILKAPLNYANVGATSLFTTVEDLSLWTDNLHNPKVGSKKLIEQMNTRTTLNNGETFRGGLGQFMNEYNGLSQIQHGGSDAGYRAFVSRFPNQDFSVVVLSNNGRFNPRRIAAQVTDLYLKPLYEETDPPTSQKAPELISLSENSLREFIGDYWNHKDAFATEILMKDGSLALSRNGRPDKLGTVGQNKFMVMNGRNNVFVSFSKSGGKLQMAIQIGENDPMLLEPYTPVSYPLNNINDYTGSYYSPELETTYRLTLENGKLLTKHQRLSDFQLTPIMKDKFDGNDFSFNHISFERNTKGQITGFRISNGRVQNLLFVKQ